MNNNMDLGVWGDGTVCLAYWDALHGRDIIYMLHDDGSVTVDGKTVDFVSELRKLAAEFKAQA